MSVADRLAVTVPSTVIVFPPSSICTAPSAAKAIGPTSPLVIVLDPYNPPTNKCFDEPSVQSASSAYTVSSIYCNAVIIVAWLAAVAPPEGNPDDSISTCRWPSESTNGT